MSTKPASTGTFAALHNANFRLYFAGQLVSTAGIWMQNIAQSYLVFQITQNPLWSGIVACAAGLPLVLLAPVTGVIVERYPRRQLMLVTQMIQMLLAFILTALVLANTVQIWQIVLLAFILGITNAIDSPSRQTFVVEMVGRDELMSGIQLNSLLNSSARLLGPTAAGVALVAIGPAWCFFLNGLSFLAVIASLLLMRVPYAIPPRRAAPIRQLREGLSYSRESAGIAPLLLITACIGFFTIPLLQLFAAFAAQALRSPETGYAWISIGQGLGSVLAGGIAGIIMVRWGRGRTIVVMAILCAISNFVFALQTDIALATLFSTAAGLFTVIEVVSVNTTLQVIVSDEYRGRVMALYTLAFMGLAPFGALVMGILAERIGTAGSMALASVVGGTLTGAVLLRWPHLIRQANAEQVPAPQEEILIEEKAIANAEAPVGR